MATEWVCPHCGGSGWKIVDCEGISGAERCECVSESRARRLEENAQIPPLYRIASFENFMHFDQWELKNVMTTVKQFAREFPCDKRPGLLLTGEAGTGKTHLAVAALRILLARGFQGLFFDYQNLLERIRSGYDAASNSSDREAYRFALEAEVLLLDDLGAHRVTDWVEDTVTAIITYRCNHRKPLIATTNLPDSAAGDAVVRRARALPGQVEYRRTLADHIGERARSRLFEMCKALRMPAVEDYRLRKS